MMDLLRKSALSLLTLLLSAHGFGQTYPQNYFRNPLQIPMKLVANFGEIRTNHWHMGLDIRTQQKVNLPVQAAAEGYVSRVAVEPGGFGQAIYISHPNGFTTVYAHMNAFFPALAAYVKKGAICAGILAGRPGSAFLSFSSEKRGLYRLERQHRCFGGTACPFRDPGYKNGKLFKPSSFFFPDTGRCSTHHNPPRRV